MVQLINTIERTTKQTVDNYFANDLNSITTIANRDVPYPHALVSNLFRGISVCLAICCRVLKVAPICNKMASLIRFQRSQFEGNER